MCPNSLAKDDPKCLNGGRLHANNSTMEGAEYYANCAYCDCPDGWSGPDCSRASCMGYRHREGSAGCPGGSWVRNRAARWRYANGRYANGLGHAQG